MLRAWSVWLLAAAFLGAGVFNIVGAPAQQRSFVRWGYPAWWCRVTGGLEIVTAGLIAFSPTRIVGLLLGGATIAAAIVTVVRARDYSHLAPLGLFAALLVLVAF